MSSFEHIILQSTLVSFNPNYKEAFCNETQSGVTIKLSTKLNTHPKYNLNKLCTISRNYQLILQKKFK